MRALLALTLLVALPARADYPWRAGAAQHGTVESRFPPPPGFRRVPAAPGSFAAWLRGLPLLPAGTPLLTHDGRRSGLPALAVADLDVGRRDLQQCADSVIRLRAEWLWAAGRGREAVFHATSGDPLPFARWARGERPRVVRDRIAWAGGAPAASDHAAYRAWLDAVFTWAGTISLRLDSRPAAGAPLPGDFLVQPGSPGHAVIVLDVAEGAGGARRLLLGEGYTPAQGFHVLPAADGSAWFTPGPDGGVEIPTWGAPFAASTRRRFE